MAEIVLPAGPITYEEVGDGPPIVFVHGVWMDSAQWAPVVERLAPRFRCVSPTLPLGAHRRAMAPDADLSLRGHAEILSEFIDRIGLAEVTLVFNDWCAAQLMIAHGGCRRVRRLVLVGCETDDNYPPGLPGRVLGLSGRVPGGLFLAAQLLRLRVFRRLPMTFGRMSARPIPDPVMDGWFEPARIDRHVRRDLRRYVSDTRRGRRELSAATSALGSFPGPVLVVWGSDDLVMPLASGKRLARAFRDSRFVEIPDARTLIPWDQPGRLAEQIEHFIESTSSTPAESH